MAPLNRLYRWLEVLPQTKLAKYLTIIIAIVCCQQLAQLSWSLISFSSSAKSNITQPFSVNRSNFSQSIKSETYTFNTIKKMMLFGPEPKFSNTVIDSDDKDGDLDIYDSLPLANINAHLMGIVSSDKQELALAIFNINNQQTSYSVGDTLAGVKIAYILHDRVIVKRQGHMEVIPFGEKGEFNTQKRGVNSPATNKKAQSKVPSKVVTKNETDNLFNYISASPVVANKKLTGYRLNPGRDPSLFNQVGLKNNDLAIAINGYDLRNEEEAQKIMRDLVTLTSVSITIVRDGELQEIQIMLDEE